MNNQHPIAPPLELIQKWWHLARGFSRSDTQSWVIYVATQAAQYGADQELEACCDWLIEHGYDIASPELRASRRPKPPSLKEQALKAAHIELMSGGQNAALIIRALEELP
jgi:hypothetical protein